MMKYRSTRDRLRWKKQWKSLSQKKWWRKNQYSPKKQKNRKSHHSPKNQENRKSHHSLKNLENRRIHHSLRNQEIRKKQCSPKNLEIQRNRSSLRLQRYRNWQLHRSRSRRKFRKQISHMKMKVFLWQLQLKRVQDCRRMHNWRLKIFWTQTHRDTREKNLKWIPCLELMERFLQRNICCMISISGQKQQADGLSRQMEVWKCRWILQSLSWWKTHRNRLFGVIWRFM